MKVQIHPELVSFFADNTGPYNWDSLPQVIGLNAKTLNSLQKGGLHKVETVFQLELAMGNWITKYTDDIADPEVYVDPSELAGVTAFRTFRGLRIYAIALSSNGLVKLINDSAKTRVKFCQSEATDEERDKRKMRDLAFENYLHNWSKNSEKTIARGVNEEEALPASAYATQEGFNAQYHFTIDEEAKPLTSAQAKYVRQLDECISDLISYARSAKGQRSHSLIAELEADNGFEIRKRFMETVARLKRVNINVLAYENRMPTRVFDSTYYEPPASEEKIHGPDSEYYLFTYHKVVVHIILAATPYLRIPFPLEESVEWEPAPMWGSKHVSDGENLDFVDHELGDPVHREPIGMDRDNVVSLVKGPNAQPDDKD